MHPHDHHQPSVLEMMFTPADNLSQTLMTGVIGYFVTKAINDAIYNHYYERSMNCYENSPRYSRKYND